MNTIDTALLPEVPEEFEWRVGRLNESWRISLISKTTSEAVNYCLWGSWMDSGRFWLFIKELKTPPSGATWDIDSAHDAKGLTFYEALHIATTRALLGMWE